MNLFIDTNIYLNFFNLSNEQLEELTKILLLQKNGEITIYLPEQTRNEFFRNRESAIKNALQQFKEDSLKDKIPNMAKTYEEYNDLAEAKAKYTNAKSLLMEKMTKDINEGALKADDLIENIFALAKNIELTNAIYSSALKRHNLGNPPGKKESIGDAVNWESLLSVFSKSIAFIPAKHDLHVLSSDGDYFSELDDNSPKLFLSQEWQHSTKGKLHVYKRIALFTKKFFPKINIDLESEKQSIIESFVESSSFRQTHQTVRYLSRIGDFSAYQVNKILNASLTNSQIIGTMWDEDVAEFIVSLLERYNAQIPSKVIDKVVEQLPLSTENESLTNRILKIIDDQIPF